MKKQDGPEQTEEKERGYMKKVQIRQASIGDLDGRGGRQGKLKSEAWEISGKLFSGRVRGRDCRLYQWRCDG